MNTAAPALSPAISALPEAAQHLRRLLGDCPVITPDALCQFAAWLLAALREQTAEQLATGAGSAQQWARPCQLAARFGTGRNQMSLWLSALREAGAVRICRPKLPDGTESNWYYNIADVERAWLLQQATPPAGDPARAAAHAQQHPYRRSLPPEQQRGLAALRELEAKIRAEKATPATAKKSI